MQIGRFEITRELGRGGMGIVYEARDTVIGRSVAIKTIRVDTTTETDALFERLLREARSAGVLAHPGIVIIHDIGRDGDVAYIAMERVDGPTLEVVLGSSRSQSNEFILDILRQAADALDHAHETGVVHRDIKPANIMLHKGKTVKITDFGIAKIQNTLHKSTGIMGTPVYMSPEHMAGRPVDGRSDQFALAVMAFQMLTGELPFQGDDIGALVYQIIHGERPLATKVNPKLRSGVDRVLRRALAKEPEDRYRTCGEFVKALTTAMTETVQMPPQPAPWQRHRSGGWRRVRWYVGGAVAAVALAWLGYVALNRGHEKTASHTPAQTIPAPPPVPSGPKPGDIKVNPKDGLKYVWIAPGTFTMGCSPGDFWCLNNEKPAHSVTVTRAFWVGQTEVTQAAYERVIGSNPSHFKGPTLPVESINWDQAHAYCAAVGMRLPTEAEWEYAARGGNSSARDGRPDAVAWYSGNSGKKTHEVGQKQPNGYGLYDMLGNVWEWVADWYDAKYYGSNPASNPLGPSNGHLHLLRGGFGGSPPDEVRVSVRLTRVPEDRQNGNGFRCVGE
jgi:formylglycine-generating enzyme required for sulfatase activity